MSEFISWCTEHDCPSKECEDQPHHDDHFLDPEFEELLIDGTYREDEDPYL